MLVLLVILFTMFIASSRGTLSNFQKSEDIRSLEILYKFSYLSYGTTIHTAQKMKFSIKDFFTKCDQIRSFLRVWSHLLFKSLVGKLQFLCSAKREHGQQLWYPISLYSNILATRNLLTEI